METMYFVEYTVHNAKSGAWAHNTSSSNSDINEVKRSWGSELNRLYGSSDFDFVSIMIVDNYGNRVMGDVKDVRVVPEPEEEVEE